MIFGFGKSREEEDDEFEEEIEPVSFQGALNGQPANLKDNARLVKAGLMAAKDIVTDGLALRAELIRFEPKGERYQVAFYIDGVASPGPKLSKQQGMAVVQVIKLLSGLNIQERKRPQSGGVLAELEEVPYQLRVSTSATPGGERLALKAINMNQPLDRADDIGITEEMRERIRELSKGRHGLILVSGAPSSGTTTTTVGVVRSVDAYQYTIFALADPEHRELSHIATLDEKEGDTFDDELRRIIRMEADIIYLNPITDEAYVGSILNVADEITMIAEISAKDAVTGLLKFCKLAGSVEKGVNALRCVVGHKLIRTLCDECKEAFRPNPKLIAKMGLPKTTKMLYRPPRQTVDEEGNEIEPCEKCDGLGYYGRTLMLELIEMTDEMKKLIISDPDPAKIKTYAKKAGMPGFQQDGIRLVAEGKVSLDELQRAFKS
ncbi:ATPase, T2SS/T4P/T4SS family [Gimesia fumaroli]|uniref:Type II secretion system protein E n=1 Tax=Gimesia fumaroli TaxID=2527976 RepID=A0A518ID62_9PLAN|nr:ATPase, T2SS/T4P/T4SS family [Gimesia fumaroli]QDV51053.1 Type II secretion system protein E [Gimesia fumaroli]